MTTTTTTTTETTTTVDPRAALRAIVEASIAPARAALSTMEPELQSARDLLAELLADPRIVAAQEAVTALEAKAAILNEQIASVASALGALDAPAAAATPAASTAKSGEKGYVNPALAFYRAFRANHRDALHIAQPPVTAACKANGIDLKDQSAANVKRAYDALVAQGLVKKAA